MGSGYCGMNEAISPKRIFRYQIFTKETMYILDACYFKADGAGVMFFDGKDDGIAFVPAMSLDFLRIEPQKPIDPAVFLKTNSRISD